MVDIHSHVLPGLDDGARTVEESLDMLRLAAARGTTDIVATPHANDVFAFDPLRVEETFHDLAERSIGIINLHLGCDFHLNYDNLRDALNDPPKYSVNHGRYLMVELPDLISVSSIRQTLSHLTRAGILPVITHPERNLSLQPNLRALENWVRDGCFLQVTGQSFLGRFGREAQRAAEWLMHAGLVHFVASDAHDCSDRPPDLSGAYKHVASRYGARRADALFIDNPTAVLWGDSIPLFAKPGKLSRLFGFASR